MASDSGDYVGPAVHFDRTEQEIGVQEIPRDFVLDCAKIDDEIGVAIASELDVVDRLHAHFVALEYFTVHEFTRGYAVKKNSLEFAAAGAEVLESDDILDAHFLEFLHEINLVADPLLFRSETVVMARGDALLENLLVGQKTFGASAARLCPMQLGLERAAIIATIVRRSMPHFKASFQLTTPPADRTRPVGSAASGMAFVKNKGTSKSMFAKL
ncbi:unnamed protein product [Symbiodinium necroappetens]|uniref:Uncharacterized protein n=1 Tax=Symbiodinium necroappetens TaxID=1628268 RepID=A0A812QST6_9DINO|nr:unnamed protein product [Symbiodinium necroappetens]